MKSVQTSYTNNDEAVAEVRAAPHALFDHLDDQTRLGEHMARPSMMMMGGRMTYAFDDKKGRAVGSVIRMGGSVLGLQLEVEEVVTERVPPTRKTWETRGEPHLLVIAGYRMGFEITPLAPDRCRVRVFIEYRRPQSLAGRLLAPLFAPIYARWCVRRMAEDAKVRFGA
jgi:hypothetical protein